MLRIDTGQIVNKLKVLLYVQLSVCFFATPIMAQNNNSEPTTAQGELVVAEKYNVTTGLELSGKNSAVLEKVISLDIENGTLEHALLEIAGKAGLKLSYSPQIVPLSKRVSLTNHKITINNALWEVLNGTSLRYAISENGHLAIIVDPDIEEATASVQFEEGMITGIVNDAATGETLPGVNVYIDELQIGAPSDLDGRFEITEVPFGTYTVQASFVGYQEYSTEVVIEEEEVELNISLQPSVYGLDDVVVTAFGVQREQRSLGYASQSVDFEELTKAKETNLINSLQGRVAGVDIVSATGNVGGSSRIVLRGVSSLSGDNQPLFIIDGVYIDNSNFDGAGAYGWTTSEVDYGNAAMDINPEDIESITVLKGPNAAALYGSRAANGAVVITTKDGSQNNGIGVDISSSTQFQTILEFPEYQNKFGQGKIDENGVPQFSYVDGRGGGVFDDVGESWGPPLDEGLQIVQWWSNGEPAPWESHSGNTRSFFNTGSVFNNSISLSGSKEDANFRLSFTNLDQTGIVPNAKMHRANISFNGGMNITNRLRAEARANYIDLEALNRAEQGYNWNNIMFTIGQWTARQIDMDRLSDYKDESGNMRNWSSVHENPYWIQYENTNSQNRDRIIGGVTLNYDVNDWLQMEGFTGTDWYVDRREARYAQGSHRTPDGEYLESTRYIKEWSSRFMVRANTDLSSLISLSGMLGAENLQNTYNYNSGHASQLSLPGVFTLENAAVRPTLVDFQSEKEVNSIYGSATIGYKDLVYLDITGRNDWSSTLPKENNSYFYPSASLSLVFTDLFAAPSWFTYGKARGGWTRVGSDTSPYQLETVYASQDPIGNIATYAINNEIANKGLKPEQTASWEVGLEMRFLDNRLGLDATYYQSNTKDQILPVQISKASGYNTQIINVGEIENHGVELTLSSTIVQTSDFTWDMLINYTRNRNEVISLAEGLESYVIGGRGASVEARPGEAFGTLYGTGYLRDESGNIVVDDRGIPIADNEIRSFGTYAPDWSGSINNQFNYKNWAFSFLIDTKQGGVIHSDGYRWGRYAGTYIETLDGRVNTFVFDGGRHASGAVKQDGTPNDIPIDMSTVYPYNRHFSNVTESTIFDASFIKLREVRLTYSLPTDILQQFFIKSVDFALIGRNLWIIDKKVPHIDPETALSAGNMQGIESNQIPPVRTYGFNVNVSF